MIYSDVWGLFKRGDFLVLFEHLPFTLKSLFSLKKKEFEKRGRNHDDDSSSSQLGLQIQQDRQQHEDPDSRINSSCIFCECVFNGRSTRGVVPDASPNAGGGSRVFVYFRSSLSKKKSRCCRRWRDKSRLCVNVG